MPDLWSAIQPRRPNAMVCGAVLTQPAQARQPRKSTFYCVETDAQDPVPAAVYFDTWWRNQGAGNWTQVFVNGLGTYAWLNTYNKRNFTTLQRHFKEAKWTVDRVDIPNAALRLESEFTLNSLGAPPNLVDLYEEKLALEDVYYAAPTQKEIESGKANPGDKVKWATRDDIHPALAEHLLELNRARRYYLLAAYALLARTQQFTHRGISVNNLVGSVLVADDGRVLSWGVNTGSYRHAEVNTLLNYFVREGTNTLPEKSVLFSTLKPCLMCSTYIKNSWSAVNPTRVWFGQYDPGPAGSAPLLGALAKSFREPGSENKPVRARRPGAPNKEAVSQGLEDALTAVLRVDARTQAANWTKTSATARALFQGSESALLHKLQKQRDDGPKRRVLEHLAPWVAADFR